jgi:3-hydroxy-9,10-secoandrosta-1,3,5(10)-triene-9,17-dione monooxygenase
MNATWWLANFPDEAQHDVWRDSPDRKMGVSLAPNGTAQSARGGFRLSGHWSWVSGVDHSDWAILGARLSDTPAEIRHFVIPRADFDIRDTWFNVGLRGSGSNDVIVDEVFVPAHRTLSMHDFREGTTPGALVNPGADYRIPMIAAMPLCLCGPLLGIGRGAFRRWLEWTSGRTATASGDAVANSLRVQLRATQSEAELDAADLLLRRNLSSLSDGHSVDLAIRSRNFAAYGVAAQFVCNAIDGLFNISGAHGLRDGMDIQRAWRDAHAIAAHTGLNAENSGQVRGQYLLGIPRNPKLRVF